MASESDKAGGPLSILVWKSVLKGYFCRGIDCFLGLSQFNFLIGKKIQPSVMDDGPKATARGPTNTVEGEMVR